MKIILSPAKKMNNDDSCGTFGQPVFEFSQKGQNDQEWGNSQEICSLTKPEFLDKTEVVLAWLKEKSYDELKAIWKCNDQIAEQNFERLAHMDLYSGLTPAILAYEGIAYQYMAPAVFESGQYDYVQDHLRILSAFYGALKAMDGVTPYRLEMGARASIANTKNLYDFWGKSLYDAVRDESGIIINLASKEYSKCVEKYLTSSDRYITISFVELAKGKSSDGKLADGKPAPGKLVTKGTYAKMARGEMVRYMAENGIENPEEIQKFDRLGYVFRDDLSSEREYVFERIPTAD